MSDIGYEAERGSGEMRRLELEVNDAESERETDVIESQSERGDCSDDQFIEIRKATKASRKKIQQEEEKYLSDCGDEEYVGFEEEEGMSLSEDYVMSEEEDEDVEVCYAEPPEKRKTSLSHGVFNSKTPAKDIKWKVGMIFADKKQFKTAVRDSSMASGRPYKYLIDDKNRMQVARRKGFPFEMWVILEALGQKDQ